MNKTFPVAVACLPIKLNGSWSTFFLNIVDLTCGIQCITFQDKNNLKANIALSDDMMHLLGRPHNYLSYVHTHFVECLFLPQLWFTSVPE